jgi:hypothetical protein
MKSMHSERIDVIAYSGRENDERPTTFILRGLRIDVVEIMDSWIEEGSKDRARKRFFRVKGSDKNTHRIFYSEDDLEWHYASQRPKKQ